MSQLSEPLDSERAVWLRDPACRNPALVGNKAAALARIAQAGYRVPNGFCLTVPAMSGGRAVWEPSAVAALTALRPPWAVRSSSASEDSQEAAYPGLVLTVLDVSDVVSALEAIDQVNASSDSDAVRAYASYHRAKESTVQMAVLVQELIVADTAGVAFTRDPLTGEPCVVVEANYGLGETVVDGSVTPDAYWVGPEHTVAQRHLGSKQEKIVATTLAGRVRRLPTSELERSAYVLNDEEAVCVADVARHLERELDCPVDMEWAFSRGELYVLQARPITGPTVDD
jgi:phosphoenolpyruvate synthase/pyruvate phosphate dikinase